MPGNHTAICKKKKKRPTRSPVPQPGDLESGEERVWLPASVQAEAAETDSRTAGGGGRWARPGAEDFLHSASGPTLSFSSSTGVLNRYFW